MKKIIVILKLLAVSASSFSQSNTITSQMETKYLQKSKHQKTVATIVLLAGPVLIITPLLIHPKTAGNATMGIVYGTIAAGFLCLPVSIPFFIRSARYKKKAMSLSFKNESTPQIQKSSFAYKSLPSLSLKIIF